MSNRFNETAGVISDLLGETVLKDRDGGLNGTVQYLYRGNVYTGKSGYMDLEAYARGRDLTGGVPVESGTDGTTDSGTDVATGNAGTVNTGSSVGLVVAAVVGLVIWAVVR